MKLGKFFKARINENIEVGKEDLSRPLCGQDSLGCAWESAGSACWALCLWRASWYRPAGQIQLEVGLEAVVCVRWWGGGQVSFSKAQVWWSLLVQGQQTFSVTGQIVNIFKS